MAKVQPLLLGTGDALAACLPARFPAFKMAHLRLQLPRSSRLLFSWRLKVNHASGEDSTSPCATVQPAARAFCLHHHHTFRLPSNEQCWACPTDGGPAHCTPDQQKPGAIHCRWWLLPDTGLNDIDNASGFPMQTCRSPHSIMVKMWADLCATEATSGMAVLVPGSAVQVSSRKQALGAARSCRVKLHCMTVGLTCILLWRAAG